MDYSQRTGQMRRGAITDDRRGLRARSRAYGASRPSGGGRNQLKARGIRFSGTGSSGRGPLGGLGPRKIVMIVLGIVLAILVLFLASSCIRSCQSNTPATSAADARVAADVSDDLVGAFTEALDQAEALEWIALHANEYPSEDLPRLALSEPAAVAFVRAYPESSKEASAYEDPVSRGEVPLLFTWDERWGAVEYDGSVLAVTGSGPVAFSMAYMGITGKGDKTPADMAELATDKGLAGGDAHTSSEFFTAAAKELGLAVTAFEPSREAISEVLDSGTVVIAEMRADSLTDSMHWVVIAYENENGSVRVYDPTSPSVSARPWDPATIASASVHMYAVSAADAEEGGA